MIRGAVGAVAVACLTGVLACPASADPPSPAPDPILPPLALGQVRVERLARALQR